MKNVGTSCENESCLRTQAYVVGQPTLQKSRKLGTLESTGWGKHMHSNRLEKMWVSKIQGQCFTWDSLKRTYLIESLSIQYIYIYIFFFWYYTYSITSCSRVELLLMTVSVLDCVDWIPNLCGSPSQKWILSKYIHLFSFYYQSNVPTTMDISLKDISKYVCSFFGSNEMRHALKVHSAKWMRQHARYQWCIWFVKCSRWSPSAPPWRKQRDHVLSSGPGKKVTKWCPSFSMAAMSDWPALMASQQTSSIWTRHLTTYKFMSLFHLASVSKKTRPHREPSLSLPSQRLCLQDINRCSDLGWRIALEAMVMWNIPWPGALLVWYSLKLSPIPHLTWR